MKKLICNLRSSLFVLLIIVLIASVVLASCAQSDSSGDDGSSISEPPQPVDESEGPIKAFDDFMEAFIAFDIPAMKERVSTPSSVSPFVDSDAVFGDMTDSSGFKTELVRKYTAHISYSRVSEVYINGDSAEFDTEFFVPDLSGEIPGIIEDVLKEMATAALTGKSFNVEEFLLDYADNKLDFNKMDTITETARVYLVKSNDGDWLIENDADKNEGFIRAVTGRIAVVIEEYSNMLP